MPAPLLCTRAHFCISGRRGFPADVRTRSFAFSSCEFVAKSRETVGILAPVGEYLHPEIEVDLRADERFDLLARGLAEAADLRALAADDDRLLTVSLHINYCADVERRALFPIFFDLDGDAVRDLVVQLLQHRLADQL